MMNTMAMVVHLGRVPIGPCGHDGLVEHASVPVYAAALQIVLWGKVVFTHTDHVPPSIGDCT